MLNIFKQAFNKDGSVNYTRASKTWGIDKNDLYFYFNPDFNLVDPASLVGGVFVAYRLSSQNSLFYSTWKQMTCYHSKDDLVLLHNLITRPREPNWATYDYLIMDSAGKILDKNFSIDQTVDENGIITAHKECNEIVTITAKMGDKPTDILEIDRIEKAN